MSLLILAGALVWVCVVWIMRMVDLVFYVGLLPVAAALTFTGNKAAFEWDFDEAVGAVLRAARRRGRSLGGKAARRAGDRGDERLCVC
jgi:hypothetical protein